MQIRALSRGIKAIENRNEAENYYTEQTEAVTRRCSVR